MPLRTLVMTPAFDISRTAVTRTNAIDFDGGGTVQLFNRQQRAAYRFNYKLEPLFRQEHEYMAAFHHEHLGGLSFMCECYPYSMVQFYQRFDYGDSGRTQFYLPNRYIGVGSFSLQSRNQSTLTTSIWSTAAYSLMTAPGILLFSSPPSSGHDLEAKYSCQYRVVFEPDGFKTTEWAQGVYRAELNLREVFLFT